MFLDNHLILLHIKIIVFFFRLRKVPYGAEALVTFHLQAWVIIIIILTKQYEVLQWFTHVHYGIYTLAYTLGYIHIYIKGSITDSCLKWIMLGLSHSRGTEVLSGSCGVRLWHLDFVKPLSLSRRWTVKINK